MSNSIGEKLTAATPILTMGLGLLALFAGAPWWWMVFAVGWLVVTPLVAILFGEDDDEWERSRQTDPAPQSTNRDPAKGEESASKQDALETLRDRYARGELSEEQFEAKLDRLLNTETLEDAREYATDDGWEFEDDSTDPTGFDEVRSDRERSDRETDYET